MPLYCTFVFFENEKKLEDAIENLFLDLKDTFFSSAEEMQKQREMYRKSKQAESPYGWISFSVSSKHDDLDITWKKGESLLYVDLWDSNDKQEENFPGESGQRKRTLELTLHQLFLNHGARFTLTEHWPTKPGESFALEYILEFEQAIRENRLEQAAESVQSMMPWLVGGRIDDIMLKTAEKTLKFDWHLIWQTEQARLYESSEKVPYFLRP